MFLGGVGLSFIDWERRYANLGYWVRTSRLGQGIAPAAVRLIARFGLYMLGLMCLEIFISPGNRPSVRVAEKVGAARVGLTQSRLPPEADRPRVLYRLCRKDRA